MIIFLEIRDDSHRPVEKMIFTGQSSELNAILHIYRKYTPMSAKLKLLGEINNETAISYNNIGYVY
jgi:hypothetical protein